MTHAMLDGLHPATTAKRRKPTRVDELEAYFRARPYVWIDSRQIAEVAGFNAWRTRISDCRIQRGMTIVNRERNCVNAARTRCWTASEYRFIPKEACNEEATGV